jgi:nitroimidazol reductase NimA-like FMN-containing flavoprotein (pyridoxamine 5'-phosphate oxidase superfamily)
MFREMRRKAQQLSEEECIEILKRATSGVLAVYGDDGYPYAVPVSHVYYDGKIAFHCAKDGHKIDAIRRNGKVSFCVIAQDEVMPKERTTAFISVIAFGKARIIEDEAGLRKIAGMVGEKFSADYPEECRKETDEVIAANRMYCVEITVEHMTGKCGKEVLLRRNVVCREASVLRMPEWED